MTVPPALTDRAALSRQRDRARRAGPALFLHDLARDGIEERLEMVNRTFTAPAVVTGWPEVWQGWRPGLRIVPDDPVLALEPEAHDLVIHALALHWAEDPVGQLVQARRALRPDGLLLAVLLGGRTLAPLRAALASAEAFVRGGLSPRVLPMTEIRDAGALLQRAGLVLPVADSELHRVSYADPLALMRDLRAMGEGNALAGRDRRAPGRALFAAAAAELAASAARSDGRIEMPFEMLILTGWSPGPGQPRPLRPGSARARLADALGALETPLPEPPLSGGN